ncbi:MAG: hypothetical protein GX905_02735 [Bacteroidales bacterium]|nr:hypothetical protein [Bacteroidales bacterium]
MIKLTPLGNLLCILVLTSIPILGFKKYLIPAYILFVAYLLIAIGHYIKKIRQLIEEGKNKKSNQDFL